MEVCDMPGNIGIFNRVETEIKEVLTKIDTINSASTLF